MRPRSAQNDAATVPFAYVRAQEVIAVAQAAARRLDGMSIAPTGAIVPHRSTAVSGFPSVPDVDAYQKLEARVAQLEAMLGTSSAEVTSFKAVFQSSLSQITEMNSRLGSVEVKMADIVAKFNNITRTIEQHENADLRRNSRLSTIEDLLAKVDQSLRRHIANQDIHVYSDGHGHRPKGFQENDQPRRFMGRGDAM